MSPEVMELFNLLESNKQESVNEVKAEFMTMLQSTKESWIVNGLVKYHIRTGSLRPVEILARVPEYHAKHIFERLEEGIKGTWKLTALSLLGHIARKNPPWIHKISSFSITKTLLKFIKYEKDIISLLNGLFVLITLLPMIPLGVNMYLQDIFDIFSILAAWDTTFKNNELLYSGYREHLQLGLYGLFYNLYGMFPCNFLDYLRHEYNRKDTQEVFNHTIRPMLETVRLHPSLVVANKQQETSNARWQKMEHHDILVECRRFSLEGSEQKPFELEESRFRSRCGTDVAALNTNIIHFESTRSSTSAPNLTEAQQTYLKTTITTSQADSKAAISISKKFNSIEAGSEKWFSLVDNCDIGPTWSAPQTPLPVTSNIYQDHPSRTPIPHFQSIQPIDSGSPPEAAIEATPENTPIKDLRPKFQFPHTSHAVRSISRTLNHPPAQSQPPSPMKKESSPLSKLTEFESHDIRRESITSTRLTRVVSERAQVEHSSNDRNSGSPLKKVLGSTIAGCSVPNSPVPIGGGMPMGDYLIAKPKPQKDGVPFAPFYGLPKEYMSNIEGLNKEDREVTELTMRTMIRDSRTSTTETPEERPQLDEMGEWCDDEMGCHNDTICHERNHGLHMPQSTSMIDFAKKVTARIRHYSQCVPDSASSSLPKSNTIETKECTLKSGKLTKVCSCPDFSSKKTQTNSTSTQTVDTLPMPYEYLLSDMVQGFCDPTGRSKLVETCSSAAKQNQPSLVEQLDKFIESIYGGKFLESKKLTDKEEIEKLREQIHLMHLHLLYERFRKEAHAVRNRRLLGKCRKSRAQEEQLIALTKQVSDLTIENEQLHLRISKQNSTIQELERKQQESQHYLRARILSMETEVEQQKEVIGKLNGDYVALNLKYTEENVDIQHLHAVIFDLSNRLSCAIKKLETLDKCHEQIKRLQYNLLICREHEIRLCEAVKAVPQRKKDIYANKLMKQYRQEVTTLQETLTSNTGKLEVLQARESELESSLTQKEMVMQELKKHIRTIKEEYGERLRAVEDKYQNLIRINQRMEGHCLELLQKVPHSPHTLSRDVTSGFSPQSSPLSASLASSEGQTPLATHVEEIRNLQVILDADDVGPSCSTAITGDNPNH